VHDEGMNAMVGNVTLWLRALATAFAVMVVCYGVLIVLARRLPPGAARELAAFIPNCVTALRRLRRDPRVPRRARVAIGIAALWVISPIDLVPEFVPVIGPLDDVIVVALCLRYAARRVPREVLIEAWPGDSHVLERLLGSGRGEHRAPGP
jgi:uncharacterized membrane protein YkvA (DUF1232 family)